VAAPESDLPGWVAPGDVLVGSLLLDAAEPAVTSIPLALEAAPPPAKSGDEGAEDEDAAQSAAGGREAEAEAEAADDEALSQALLAARLGRLKELRASNASAARYERLASAVLAEHPEHLPLLLERLSFAREAAADDDGARARRVGAAATELLSSVNVSELAQYYGVAHDAADATPEAKKVAKKMDERRAALRTALLARASALAPPRGSPPPAGDEAATTASPFVSAVREMKAWVDGAAAVPDEEDKDTLALTLVRYELAMGRPGSALATLRARLAAQPSGSKRAEELCRELGELCRGLGLEHWTDAIEETRHKRFPVAERPL